MASVDGGTGAIVHPSTAEPAMASETFGPIVPIRTVESPYFAAEFINYSPRPAELFVSSHRVRGPFDAVSVGGAAINHVAMHCPVPQPPFAGVSACAMCAHHCLSGFETLSLQQRFLDDVARPNQICHPDPFAALNIAFRGVIATGAHHAATSPRCGMA
jgi:aldehyde dehydrogenase (NAD+)